MKLVYIFVFSIREKDLLFERQERKPTVGCIEMQYDDV